jgi:hypothetical protein
MKYDELSLDEKLSFKQMCVDELKLLAALLTIYPLAYLVIDHWDVTRHVLQELLGLQQ